MTRLTMLILVIKMESQFRNSISFLIIIICRGSVQSTIVSSEMQNESVDKARECDNLEDKDLSDRNTVTKDLVSDTVC